MRRRRSIVGAAEWLEHRQDGGSSRRRRFPRHGRASGRPRRPDGDGRAPAAAVGGHGRTARPDTATPVRRFAGTIRARTETDLGFRVGGKLPRARPRRSAPGRRGRRGGDARRATRSPAATRGGRGALAGGADRAREGRDRPGSVTAGADVAGPATRPPTHDGRRRGTAPRGLQAERSVEPARNALSYATLRADAPAWSPRPTPRPDRWSRSASRSCTSRRSATARRWSRCRRRCSAGSTLPPGP